MTALEDSILCHASLTRKEANMLANNLLDIIDAFDEFKNNNGWIPCSERLPEENKNVYITFIGRLSLKPTCSELAHLFHGKWYWQGNRNEVAVKVIAWKEHEFPEPYIPPEETQVCTNKECFYNAEETNIECPAWNGCGRYQPKNKI